ncbi:MAG: hypothetical protein ABSG45_06805 [Nitrososphaerales archaeon]
MEVKGWPSDFYVVGGATDHINRTIVLGTEDADVYLRRFDSALEEKNLSPHDLLKIEQGELFNFLLDIISRMEKDVYAERKKPKAFARPSPA